MGQTGFRIQPKGETKMASSEGLRLSQLVRQKSGEFIQICKGIDEATASRAPAGRWSPKEIASHLCGPEGIGFMASIQTMLREDTPRLDIKPEDAFFTENRSKMSLTALLSEMEIQYGKIADLAAGLSPEQLARKAHIPLLKETPLGEYPTVAMWIEAIASYHVGFHIDHMKEILQTLGVASSEGEKKNG
jgi:hypothetical protein